jgi:hypothetical protein
MKKRIRIPDTDQVAPPEQFIAFLGQPLVALVTASDMEPDQISFFEVPIMPVLPPIGETMHDVGTPPTIGTLQLTLIPQ